MGIDWTILSVSKGCKLPWIQPLLQKLSVGVVERLGALKSLFLLEFLVHDVNVIYHDVGPAKIL